MNELDVIMNVIQTLSQNTKCKSRYSSELDNFYNRKKQVESNKYRLGVIGVTSSGKSTMINSLLGESLLPTVARPSSSQLVSCYHSTKRAATVYFQDGGIKQYSGKALNQSLLEKYGDEYINSNNREKVKQIELSTPDFPFDDNIIMIDSPGLDAYGYAGHEQLTMNSLLPTIDFCVFVTTCKTNSDEKMLSVLNTIADYEKPVIIVQNMIDSIKPSLDGKKSISDVAQEHRMRVERIINHSNVKDKSKVYIVQISSINALNARKNKLKTKEDKKLLELSNYEKLISVVNTAFNQVRPIVEGHRLRFLKKEIQRIAKAAKEDGASAYGIVNRFQYGDIEAEYKKKKEDCLDTLNKEFEKLKTTIATIKDENSFSENDVNRIIHCVSNCEAIICNQMKILNSSIISVCNELNIDSRNIVTDFRFDKPDLYIKKKTEVVKDGYWKKGGRHWYTLWLIKEDDVWIDTSYTTEVTDICGTRQNAVNYINSTIRVFRQTIQRWQKSIEVTERKLFSEIENRRSEYNARLNQALDCQAYQQIGTELSRIAESIIEVKESDSCVNTSLTDVKKSPMFTIMVNKELLPMYRLSENLRIKIQFDTFRFYIDERSMHIIIGWDEYCEAKFLRYAFCQELNPININQGQNIVCKSVELYHKPKSPVPRHGIPDIGVYILVNATQIGSATNEISRLNLSELLQNNVHVYFVVQDFNEVSNGNSVAETLDNIVNIKQQLNLNKVRFRYLLLHDNPIYNLAAVEAQSVGCTTQFDEIKILNDLQTKFCFLLPQDRSKRNVVESTIRIIIQKLGNI